MITGKKSNLAHSSFSSQWDVQEINPQVVIFAATLVFLSSSKQVTMLTSALLAQCRNILSGVSLNGDGVSKKYYFTSLWHFIVMHGEYRKSSDHILAHLEKALHLEHDEEQDAEMAEAEEEVETRLFKKRRTGKLLFLMFLFALFSESH